MLRPVVDIVFRKLFGTPANTNILRSFLHSVLKIPAEELETIEFLDSFLLPDKMDEKYGIVDLHVQLKNKKKIHVEVQTLTQDAFEKRITWYNSKLLNSQLDRGQHYQELQPTISIIIACKSFIKSSKYHHRFFLSEPESGVILTDIIEVHTLELDKLPVEAEDFEMLGWARFFVAEKEEEFEMATKTNPEVKAAYGKLIELSEDEKTRFIYERQMLMKMDEEARRTWAERKGREEGRMETAKNLLNLGTPLEVIKQATGLTEEQILGNEE